MLFVFVNKYDKAMSNLLRLALLNDQKTMTQSGVIIMKTKLYSQILIAMITAAFTLSSVDVSADLISTKRNQKMTIGTLLGKKPSRAKRRDGSEPAEQPVQATPTKVRQMSFALPAGAKVDQSYSRKDDSLMITIQTTQFSYVPETGDAVSTQAGGDTKGGLSLTIPQVSKNSQISQIVQTCVGGAGKAENPAQLTIEFVDSLFEAEAAAGAFAATLNLANLKTYNLSCSN